MPTYNYILKMNNLTSFTLFSAMVPFCDIPCLYVIGYLNIHQIWFYWCNKTVLCLLTLEMQLHWPLRD